jgi:hypothetical protein
VDGQRHENADDHGRCRAPRAGQAPATEQAASGQYIAAGVNALTGVGRVSVGERKLK